MLLHYMDTDSFVLSVNTKGIKQDSKNLDDLFDFRKLGANHELFSNENKKAFWKYKIETPKKMNGWKYLCKK